MGVLKVVTRSAIVFPLAIAVALAMVLISEATYWRQARMLNEITETSKVIASIHSLRQNLFAAQAAQRNYLLTKKQVSLAAYNKALQGVAISYEVLQQRYDAQPEHTAVLKRLQSVTNEMLSELTKTISQFDLGQRIELENNDDVQFEGIRVLSAELLDVETNSVIATQVEIRETMFLRRVAVALLSVLSLLALGMYLRQSVALERKQNELQFIVQAERDRLELEVRNRLELEVRQRTAQLTELTLHLQTAREDERNRLARNLHDDLGALLTSAKLDAARIRSRLTGAGAAPEALALLAHLVGTLNSGIALGRSIIEDLRPSGLGTLGLVATLEILAAEYASNAGVQVHRVLEPVALDANSELMVFRLVQEALTNISKHANARQVWVTMGYRKGLVEVSVRDDGAGFDSQAKTKSAYGLVGMRFRVEAEGGTLVVKSKPSHGTLIQVRLPGLDVENPSDAKGNAA
jgi:signal transduction histidine kinase